MEQLAWHIHVTHATGNHKEVGRYAAFWVAYVLLVYFNLGDNKNQRMCGESDYFIISYAQLQRLAHHLISN